MRVTRFAVALQLFALALCGSCSEHHPRPQNWRLVPTARFGANEVVQHAVLKLDEHGRLHIGYASTPGIHVLDGFGQQIRSYGDSGPGKVGDPTGLDWDKEENVWVVDRATNQFFVFDSVGRYLRSVSRTSNANGSHWEGGFDLDGRFYDFAFGPGGLINPMFSRLSRNGVTTDTVPLPYHPTWIRPDRRRTLPKFPEDRRPGPEQSAVAAFALIDIPYAGSFVWRFDPRGSIWFGRTDVYRIYERRFDGDTVRVHQGMQRPVPVTAVEKEELFPRSHLPDTSFIPSFKPIYEALYLDDDGRVWVRLISWEDRGFGPDGRGWRTVFDVFDEDGYLARVEADFWTPLDPAPVFRADTVYLVSYNSSESMSGDYAVVRAQIVR